MLGLGGFDEHDMRALVDNHSPAAGRLSRGSINDIGVGVGRRGSCVGSCPGLRGSSRCRRAVDENDALVPRRPALSLNVENLSAVNVDTR